ncbi:vWA domain-containing protein [Variovorax sp. VNK109]|uniref:vWA domain-containing protein n=1 Tax=Variovorax sp. VNK109 TaxID=3400919 RepID=UPI003BFE3897
MTRLASSFSPRLQRSLAALLCTQMLMACAPAGALSIAPVPQDGALWPEPRPLPHPMPQPYPQPDQQYGTWAPLRVSPNFQAPSANTCARPIQTREVPGIAQNSQREHRRHGALASELAASGEAGDARLERSAAPTVSRAAPAAPPAPTASAAKAMAAESSERERRADIAADRAWAEPAPQAAPHAFVPQRPRPSIVTAGMVDDNAAFSEYLAFRNRTQVTHRPRDVSERYLLEVKDARGRNVPDAEVLVRSPGGQAMWARTDAAGRVWLHPNAFDPVASQVYEVSVRKQGQTSRSYLRRGQKSAVEVRLGTQAVASRAQLDLVFLIDATGSMADEIDKLKASLRSIAAEVAQLPSRPDLCFGMVAYRDKGDPFVLRSHDFTNDLNAFQGVLNKLRADGGGDYPEAMNEALNEAVHNLNWRGNGATRMVVLLADAPPHLDYAGPQYDDDMVAALGKGIKIFSVGASGLDKQGEFIQRQIAQYTGGRFVFLTYANAAVPASGPGRETVHDVNNYSVDTLDRLIVRLVSEELARLPAS